MKSEITAGLVSSAVAIPLSMAFGMFAFVSLGDEYFAYGAMAGLVSTVIAGLVCVLTGDRSTRIYAPRITTTFFLGLLLHSLLERLPQSTANPMSPRRCWCFSQSSSSLDYCRRYSACCAWDH